MKELVKSYAKINLGLEVVKKTKKNYHKLKMIMTLIDLYDEIIFSEGEDLVVTTDNKVCRMEDNLCYKVALYLKELYKIKKGIHIHINKKIPDGGGLGGGSSNAAAVISFLNTYWNLHLSKRKCKKIGFKFGCDIPYFFERGTAYVRGYGEKVKPLKKQLEEDDIIVVIPKFKMSTKDVFENHIIKRKKSIKRLKYKIENNLE